IACVATSLPFHSATLWIRESMLVVIVVPFGCTGETTPDQEFTVTTVFVNVAELESTLVIFMTLIDVLPPVETSHIGSPATESCITVGRKLKNDDDVSLRNAVKVPFTRSLIFTLTTCTWLLPATANILSVKTKASAL